MEATDLHYELHVRDLQAARRFYVGQLGLPVLQETAAIKLLAVRIGKSRLSIFGDRDAGGATGPSQIILAVADIDEALAELRAKGVDVRGEPVTAGNFLRFVEVLDPDGNVVAIAEYFRDPMTPV